MDVRCFQEPQSVAAELQHLTIPHPFYGATIIPMGKIHGRADSLAIKTVTNLPMPPHSSASKWPIIT
jgi:hypothetical protein